MMKRIAVFIIFLICCPLWAQEKQHDFKPSIYAFQNGVRFGSADADIKKLRELGYDGIGSVYPKAVPDYLTACKQHGLKLFSSYLGGKVTATGFKYDPSVSVAIRSLKGSGAFIELYIQTGDGANDEQAILFIREIAQQAEDSGLRVVLYPHHRFYVETIDDALRLAKASECANVGVMFNLCHFLRVEPESNLSKTLSKAKPLLWSVSTCGADKNGKDWPTLIRPLGEGSFDQKSLLRILGELGYQGPIGLQCYGIKIPSKEHLHRSIQAWKLLSEQ